MSPIAQLFGDDEAVVVVGDHDRGGESAADRPTGGFLQQGLLGEERPELLRISFPRDRPEPRAGTACQNHLNQAAAIRGDAHGGVQALRRIDLHLRYPVLRHPDPGDTVHIDCRAWFLRTHSTADTLYRQ
jgi:hypothetical protein